MGHKHNELRVKKYKMKDGRVITVNTNPRHGVGYRATIRGQAGKYSDSTVSPEEAIGRLLINWDVITFMGIGQ